MQLVWLWRVRHLNLVKYLAKLVHSPNYLVTSLIDSNLAIITKPVIKDLSRSQSTPDMLQSKLVQLLAFPVPHMAKHLESFDHWPNTGLHTAVEAADPTEDATSTHHNADDGMRHDTTLAKSTKITDANAVVVVTTTMLTMVTMGGGTAGVGTAWAVDMEDSPSDGPSGGGVHAGASTTTTNAGLGWPLDPSIRAWIRLKSEMANLVNLVKHFRRAIVGPGLGELDWMEVAVGAAKVSSGKAAVDWVKVVVTIRRVVAMVVLVVLSVATTIVGVGLVN